MWDIQRKKNGQKENLMCEFKTLLPIWKLLNSDPLLPADTQHCSMEKFQNNIKKKKKSTVNCEINSFDSFHKMESLENAAAVESAVKFKIHY